MADITPVAITSTLTARAFTPAASGGDKLLPASSAQFLIAEFKNTNVAARTVTITPAVASKQVDGYGVMTVPNMVLALAQNDEAVAKIPLNAFQDAADANKVAITYDNEVGVELRAFAI